MNWSVVMITAPRQKSTILETLQSLQNAGWEQPWVVAEPGAEVPSLLSGSTYFNAKRRGAWPNFRYALEIAMEDPCDFIFVIQDDVIFSKGLRDWLEAGNLPDVEGLGIASLYCCGAHAGRHRGWWSLPSDELPRKAYGALAYLIPPAVAQRLIDSPPGGGGLTKIDFWCGRACRDWGLRYCLHSPSLAQHIGETSVIHEDIPFNPLYRSAADFQVALTQEAVFS